MSTLKLMVIGERYTTQMFAMLGAEARVAEEAEALRTLLTEIEERQDELGGILLSGSLAEGAEKEVNKIRALGLPVIFLPSLASGANAGYEALEKLSERAMGMKLPLK